MFLTKCVVSRLVKVAATVCSAVLLWYIIDFTATHLHWLRMCVSDIAQAAFT